MGEEKEGGEEVGEEKERSVNAPWAFLCLGLCLSLMYHK